MIRALPLSLLLPLLFPLLFQAPATAQSQRLRGVAQTDDGRYLALRASLTGDGAGSFQLEIEVKDEGRHHFSGRRTEEGLEFYGRTTTGIVGAISPGTGQLFHALDLADRGQLYAGVWRTETSSGPREARLVLEKIAPRATGGISAGVGPSGPNRAADVRWVQIRLRELGFDWVDVDGAYGPQLSHALRAFEAMVTSKENVSRRGGQVAVRGNLDHWLHADNAPRWGLYPSRGTGFLSLERVYQTNDDHDFATSWLSAVLVFAGQRYERDYRSRNPAAMPILANDVSRDRCRDTRDHEGHETGLSLDVGLPRTDGSRAGARYTWNVYDRAATRAILQAFRAHPLVKDVYFQDPVLIRERLCVSRPSHADHLHIQLEAPGREGGRRP